MRPSSPRWRPSPATAAAAELDVPYVDLNASICPSDTCPVVVGGVLVYRDTAHLSDTYVRTLIPQLAAAFDSVGVFDSSTT